MISYGSVFWLSLVAIVPVSFWLLFFRSSEKSYWSQGFLLVSFWLGVLSSLLAVLLELFYFENRNSLLQESGIFSNESFILSILGSVLPVALIEEFSKSIVLVWAMIKKKILSLQDGLILGVLAGLAFAVTENGIYFVRFYANQEDLFSGNFWQVVFLRFIFSTSAHVIYSGLCGFFLAELLAKDNWQGKIKSLSKAFFFSVAVHTSFNFILETSFAWLVFFIVFFGLVVILYLYFKKESSFLFRESNVSIKR